MSQRLFQHRARTAALIAGLACCVAIAKADGPGQSFTSLQSPFRQELYGVTALPVMQNDGVTLTDGFLGGVAFAPGGDVWTAECVTGPKLHRFDRQNVHADASGTTVHDETVVDQTASYAAGDLGCGLVNHPNGLLYVNTPTAIWSFNADTGMQVMNSINSASVFKGNGRGIAVDPLGTNHLVYPGNDCDVTSPKASCTLWDLDPLPPNTTRVFARITRQSNETFDTLYFSPDGSSVFLTYKDAGAGTQGVVVIARPAALMNRNDPADDSQIRQRILMPSKPAGVAFTSTFAVTSNEDGTLTRLSFPGGYGVGATQSSFGAGGFTGDMLQVGADGCAYLTQGRRLASGGTDGVRFNDGSTGPSDSVVRICGGFLPAPGVEAGGPWSAEPGNISGTAFQDLNKNGVQDAGEPGVASATMSLSGAATASVATGANGTYTFANVAAGLYSVSAPATTSGLNGPATPAGVDLASGENRTGVNFAFSESSNPVCSFVVQSGSPVRIVATASDAQSGLTSIQLTALSNVQVAVGSNPAVSAPATVNFSPAAVGNVTVTATRVVAAQSASFTFVATDAFGNTQSCTSPVVAPEAAPPPPPPPPPPPVTGKVVTRILMDRGWGWGDVDVVPNPPQTLRYVKIVNRAKGLKTVALLVNHRWFTFNLKNGQTVNVDIGAALKAKHNGIVLAGWGQKFGSAEVTLSEKK